jgi:hypothetical protein
MKLECRVWLDGEDCGTVPIVDHQGQLVFGDACYWLIDLLEAPESEEHTRYAQAEAHILSGIARRARAGTFVLEGRSISWRVKEAATS